MKPLPRAPLTDEDSDIWVCVGLRPCFVRNEALERVSELTDRRDAELMHDILIVWSSTAEAWDYFYPGVRHTALAFVGVESWYYLLDGRNITSCA